jgi:hypothetical protein
MPCSSACYVLHAGFLLGLFFDPEDRGNVFLQNVCWFSTDYMALYPRRQSSSRYISYAVLEFLTQQKSEVVIKPVTWKQWLPRKSKPWAWCTAHQMVQHNGRHEETCQEHTHIQMWDQRWAFQKKAPSYILLYNISKYFFQILNIFRHPTSKSFVLILVKLVLSCFLLHGYCVWWNTNFINISFSDHMMPHSENFDTFLELPSFSGITHNGFTCVDRQKVFESVDSCSCKKSEAGSWGRGSSGTQRKGNVRRWSCYQATATEDWKDFVCCSYSDLWSV